MLLPALNSARERAYTIQCVNNLKQIGLCFNSYYTDFSSFPIGSISGSGNPLCYPLAGVSSVDGSSEARNWFEYFAQVYFNKKYGFMTCPAVVKNRANPSSNRGMRSHYGMNGYLTYKKVGDWDGFSGTMNHMKSPSKVIMATDSIRVKENANSQYEGYYYVTDASNADMRHGKQANIPDRGDGTKLLCDGHVEKYTCNAPPVSNNTDFDHPLNTLRFRKSKPGLNGGQQL